MRKFFMITQAEIREKVLSLLDESSSFYRKTLINEAVKLFNLSEEELRDTTPDSKLNRLKSNIGSVISRLIHYGDLVMDDNKKLSLTKFKTMLVEEAKIEEFILALIERARALNFSDVLKECAIKFKTSKTDTLEDDAWLKTGVSNVLDKLCVGRVLVKDGAKYRAAGSTLPLSPIGACVERSYGGKDVGPYLIRAINLMGGEFFENYSVKLLEKYFRVNNYEVISASVTGGSQDNGIDGIIEVVDDLGYSEKIYVQCKVRSSAEVTLNEVRQFMGAVVGEQGTRGIFMTNNRFHSEAQRFISKVHNLIGIDGEKLAELAKTYFVGVVNKDGKLVLDKDEFVKTNVK